MKKNIQIAALVLLGLRGADTLRADPLLTSWFTTYSGKYARIYTNATMELAGTPVTTWSNGTRRSRCRLTMASQEIDYRRTGFISAAPAWAVTSWARGRNGFSKSAGEPENVVSLSAHARRDGNQNPSAAAERSVILWMAWRCSIVGTLTIGAASADTAGRQPAAIGIAMRM